jgi:uncharacterized protein (DUF58 family)
MIPKEILKKIQHIDIITNRIVTEVLAGRYHSVFKGRGIEFSEVREYQYGDDIRSIDWNVFARLGQPYIKKFVEERELTVILLVDVSASIRFGTKKAFKSDVAAEISALLSFSAIKNNDKVGVIFFSDTIEKYIPPKKGRNHVLRLIRDVLCYEPKGKTTNLNSAFEYLNKVIKKKSVVFVISDFMAEDYEKSLKITNKRHDIIPVCLVDPMERELPDIGIIELEDEETGEVVIVDTSEVQDEYSKKRKAQTEKRKRIFQNNKIEEIAVHTDEDYIKSIIRFFKKRERKLR